MMLEPLVAKQLSPSPKQLYTLLMQDELFGPLNNSSVDHMYEGRLINKLQNGAIPLSPKIGKIKNIRFVENLILKIHRNFFDDDVIIVTSSVRRTQSICVLFSPPVFYHNSQVK